MELIIGIIVIFLLIIGIIGSFVPAIPGPPISYGALLLSHFYVYPVSNEDFLWLMAVVVISVTIFDFWVQVYGVKKFGGSKKAINGSIIGLIIGLIFLPGIGIILGPFIGAFIGAKMEDPDVNKALKIALGALAGFMVGTLLKLSVSLYIVYEIYSSVPSLW
jgi:uncharacterized protein YqgC (DUF456 family)|tara:strand:- start:521 stop:1006 length:486 start_codon:yes stop_codon:yes gene_type:complete